MISSVLLSLALVASPGLEPVELALITVQEPRTPNAVAIVTCTSTASAEATHTQEVQVGTRVSFSLPGGSVWLCRASGPSVWSPETLVVVRPGGVQASLPIYRGAEVRATLKSASPQGAELDPVKVRFRQTPKAWRASQAPAEPALAGDHLSLCRTEGVGVRCAIPDLTLDFDLKAPAHAGAFFFARRPNEGGTLDLSSVRLEPGSSIAGFVNTPNGALPAEPVKVSLLPALAGSPGNPDLANRMREPIASTTTRERGFFQLTSIPPGAYRLSMTATGWVESRPLALNVEPAGETRLRSPLQLLSPLEVGFAVFPPTQPSGEPWELGLSREDLGLSRSEAPLLLRSDARGAARFRGLAPGTYLLRILPSEGDAVVERVLELDRSQEVELSVTAHQVVGSVEWRGEPVACELRFGGRSASGRARLWSDIDGQFVGTLPHLGTWTVRVECREPRLVTHVRLEVPEPEPGEPARIEIELPATRLAGRVLGADDKPVAGAQVQAGDALGASTLSTTTDVEGRFELLGLSPGNVLVDAAARVEGELRRALPLRVTIEPKTDRADLRLRLVRDRLVRGILSSRLGPVRGARILADPLLADPEAPGAFQAQAVTGAQGEWELELPGEAVGADLVILAPGQGLELASLAGDLREPVSLGLVGAGGSLVVLTPGQGEGGASALAVFVDGRGLGEGLLRQWVSLNGLSWSIAELVLPGMPPGTYQVCRAPSDQLMALSLSGSPSAASVAAVGRCAQGTLAPAGQLVLELPNLPAISGR